jgi:uncharacterized protein
MKTFITAFLLLIGFFTDATAQSSSAEYAKPHRIVMHLATDDTTVHKALMLQLNNIMKASPESQVEVVCHGPGLSILLLDKTVVRNKIAEFNPNKVSFVACEYSIQIRNLTKDALLPEAGTVQYGILELVTKQEAGWSYIKSGH